MRPIEYDKQKFIDKTTQLFLEKGYKRISMRDILNHTGFNRHSLYKLYENKNALYRETLKNYRDHFLFYGYEILNTKPYGLNNVKKFFGALLSCDGPVNCLMVNTIADCDEMDPDSLELAKVHFSKIKKLYELNYQQAITEGTISSQKNASVLAGVTVNYMQGLPVSSRMFGNKKVMLRTNQFIALICC